MSTRAVLAHERGHAAFRGTSLEVGAWNDEFRASYWAAKNVPGLSTHERVHLIQDALLRAQEAGVLIRPNKFMRGCSMGTSEKPDFEEEERNAEAALEEWERTGHTERRCLRCGGRYIFEVTPSAYRIRCERDDCFVLTVRGI